MLRMKIMELEDMWHPTARNAIEFLKYMVCIQFSQLKAKQNVHGKCGRQNLTMQVDTRR